MEFDVENEVVTQYPEDGVNYVTVLHDSLGEEFVNLDLLAERNPVVNITRVLSAMNVEPRGGVQFFLEGSPVSADTPVSAGNELYIVGKLAGGK